MASDAYRIALYEDPGEIAAADWDALVAADAAANPFLRHAFLHALHASGSAVPQTGWRPCFLTLWEGDARLAAAMPLYVKSHSYGEYVFDWSWADACERMGRNYYPKWLVAVPFTPVQGTRILAVNPGARRAARDALVALVQGHALSSLHVLFAPADEIAELADAGLLVRKGVQFHWRNQGFADFDAYLAHLAQAKRKKVRAERRKVADAGVQIERRVGAQIRAEDWRFFHRCYTNTYAEHGAEAYLNLDFFERIGAAMPEHLLLVRALRAGLPVACALGVFDRARGALYGRYWGALAAIPCLHFECCYYQMIEFAIEQGLQVCEGGAQGAHKLARGFDPVTTYSAHWLRAPALHAAVGRALEREDRILERSIEELDEHRAWRAALARGPQDKLGHAPPEGWLLN